MNECITKTTCHFSPAASLAALGVKMQQLDLFGPIRQRVQIVQKTVKYTPIEKVYDAFISLLAGAQGVGEINHLLRSDPGLQRAFGRSGCAEQSVVQQTLDACSPSNVTQMEQAMADIYQRHSQGFRHDYQHEWQILDVDMSGMPCGAKAAFASKGYFAKQCNRRGRQLGRVLASRYDEVVVDQLFDGTTQLNTALQPLMEAAERTLQLDETRRARTIVRMDAGGGSLADVNWLLARGYQVQGKDYSSQRAAKLAQSVTLWFDDPCRPGRQLGWVTAPALDYVRPVRRLAVRSRQANGQWRVGVLLSTLSPEAVLHLTGQSVGALSNPLAVMLAYLNFYDQRGAGVETSFKEDKQGLGLTKRNKKRFVAQQMLMLLGTLAHNVVVWARRWLAAPQLRPYGVKRMVRDVFHISGFLCCDATGQVIQLTLNQDAPLARCLIDPLRKRLASLHVVVILDKT
jgi:hypothetical protein